MAAARSGSRSPSNRRSPRPGTYQISTGTADIVRDPRRRSGWLLVVNGLDSSYVDLSDPGHIEFEYLAWMAAAIDAAGVRRDRPPRIVHLGGGGCTLARHLAAARPDTEQLVLEVDPDLIALVTDAFGLAEVPGLVMRQADAAAALRTLAPSSYDIVVRDAFVGGSVPAHLTTSTFLDDVIRVLTPGGIYLANVPAGPDLHAAEAEAEIARAAFDDVALLIDPGQFHARRFGNVVLVASNQSLPRERLSSMLQRLEAPAYVVPIGQGRASVVRTVRWP